MRIEAVVLSGTAKASADAVARESGIHGVHAELFPHRKTGLIATHVRKSRMVEILGDGIYDTPALSEVTVGIAMGARTEVAR